MGFPRRNGSRIYNGCYQVSQPSIRGNRLAYRRRSELLLDIKGTLERQLWNKRPMGEDERILGFYRIPMKRLRAHDLTMMDGILALVGLGYVVVTGYALALCKLASKHAPSPRVAIKRARRRAA